MNTRTLNLPFLRSFDAPYLLLEFVEDNNLERFPLSLVPEVEGDFKGCFEWVQLKSIEDSELNYPTTLILPKFDSQTN